MRFLPSKSLSSSHSLRLPVAFLLGVSTVFGAGSGAAQSDDGSSSPTKEPTAAAATEESPAEKQVPKAGDNAPSADKSGDATESGTTAPPPAGATTLDAAASPTVTFDGPAPLPDAPKASDPKPVVVEEKPEVKEETPPSANKPPPAVAGEKPRMLVMGLVDNGAGKEVTKAVTAAMNQQAIKSYNGIVTTAEEIRLTLTVSAQQQLTGCMEPRCMANVGKTIEADIVLGGNVSKVGDDIVITILSTNARSGERMGSEQRKVPLHQSLYFYAAQQLTSLVITGKVVSSRVPVRINASESAAEVLVDGRALGYAPMTVDLDPGQHVVRVTQGGYVPWQSTITVVDGTPLEVNATLSSESIALWPVAIGAGVVSTLFLGMAAVSLELAYENYNGGLGLGDLAHDNSIPILVDLIPRSSESYRQIKSFNAADLATLQSRTNTQTAVAAGFGGVAGIFALSAAALLTADLIME